jgi:hypothetical protein
VRNPLAASGGTAPEPLEEVKRLAPEAFRTDLRRAVVPDDYARLVTAHYPEVQRAAAARRWTGVESVAVTRLRRLGEPGGAAAPDFLDVGPLEIVRVDNDPNHAENGLLRVNVGGGR